VHANALIQPMNIPRAAQRRELPFILKKSYYGLKTYLHRIENEKQMKRKNNKLCICN